MKTSTLIRNNEIIAKRRKGVSPSELASMYGISVATVYHITSVEAGKTPPQQVLLKTRNKKIIYAYRAEVFSKKEIAEKFNVSPSTVHKVVKDAGLIKSA
jgi:transposase